MIAIHKNFQDKKQSLLACTLNHLSNRNEILVEKITKIMIGCGTDWEWFPQTHCSPLHY